MNEEAATILIVDDLPANRLVLERHVERLGHHAISAENGLIALELLRSRPVDLVLLDVMMPVLNGFETLEAMKADAALATIPVVVISALNDVSSIAQCISLGAEDFLFKPVERVLLEARIESSLARKRMYDRAQAAHATAEAANQAKGRFVSLVAHELKSPLTAMIGYAELLLVSDDQTSGSQRESAAAIRSLGGQLARLIDDLSDLSRMESGHLQLSPRPFPLEVAIDTALMAVDAELRSRRLELRLALGPELPPVWADEVRLVQILTNLLSNACKYAPEGHEVTLLASRRDTAVEVTVHNSGGGIDPSDQPHIFEPFFRSSAASVLQQRGTGLGLSITKQLVELHGGRIWFTSDPGNGTAFTFTLLAASSGFVEAGVTRAELRHTSVEPLHDRMSSAG
jgi:signal transduction histidine kinase